MSSRRVINLELSEAQRIQVRQVRALEREVRTGRTDCAGQQVLAQPDQPVAWPPSYEGTGVQWLVEHLERTGVGDGHFLVGISAGSRRSS